jgi:hypothetical protein
MLFTIFCGAGSGVFLTMDGTSLFGVYLYSFFPFAAVLMFLSSGYDLVQASKSVAAKPADVETKVQKEEYSHHPKAA